MAQALLVSTTSPLLSQKAGYSARPNNNVVAPSLAYFAHRRPLSRLGRVRAQGNGENKDNSVDVHVTKGDQGTAVERKPRGAASDISPLGKSPILYGPHRYTISIINFTVLFTNLD